MLIDVRAVSACGIRGGVTIIRSATVQRSKRKRSATSVTKDHTKQE